MEKNAGFRRAHFDDDVFDFRRAEDEAFVFHWRDRDHDDHGHDDDEANEHVVPLPYDAAAFPNDVSSGDVTQTSAVLWARAGHSGRVTFQVATDAGFHHVVDVLTVDVSDSLVPAKVDVDNLHPDQRYYFRAIDTDGHVAEGTLETSARLGQHEGFSFGVGGDTRGELAPYPSIKNAPTAGLDLFIKLGDTVYADQPSPVGGPAHTLQEFEAKHNEVYSSHLGINSWAALQSTTPILSIIDDGDVIGSFAGGAPAGSDPRFTGTGTFVSDQALYRNAVTAFGQYNAIEDKTYSGTGDPRFDGKPDFYRYDIHGSDAAVFLVDDRTFRDAELPETTPFDTPQFLAASFDPTRTMLGHVQLAQLEHDLLDAQSKGITWKFVNISDPIQNLGPILAADRFEGYASERNQLLKFINDQHIENVVFVSAEAHTYSVNNLTYQDHFGGPQIATSAIEVDTMAVASQLIATQIPPLLVQAGILPPAQLALYNSLPLAAKDDFVKQLIDKTFLAPFGYDPIGLDDNLAATSGKVHAELLQCSYFVSNDLGWTKFEVDQGTQSLLVTTYGIPAYTTADLAANPNVVEASTPTIVSQFRLKPTVDVTVHDHERVDPPGSDFANVTFALGAKGTLGIDGASFSGQVSGFAPGDRLDFSNLAFGSKITVGFDAATHHLTVGSGVQVAEVTLVGDYAASMFATESDGHGGTIVGFHANGGWLL